MPDDKSKFAWTRSIGKYDLSDDDQSQTFTLDKPVDAEYVNVRILENGGGEYVALGEVELLTSASLVSDAPETAAAVWPNIAATGKKPNIGWQLIAYVIFTAAEILISITCLEFSYTQAPNRIKSFIMALYLLSVAAGNLLVALVNWCILKPDGTTRLDGPAYFWFFTGLVALTSFVYLIAAKTYRGKTYIQGESEITAQSTNE